MLSCSSVISNLRENPFEKDFPEVYKIRFPQYVDKSRIEAKTNIYGKPVYNFHDIKFKIDDQQIFNLLMGHNLYGNTEIALRELVQNALDACNVRSIFTSNWEENYSQEIVISFIDEDSKSYLIVEDNGIGMDIDIFENYFAVIGKSYYSSQEFYSLLAEKQSQFIPISKFGIGFLSCFMISNNITIETKKLKGQYDSSSSLFVRIGSYERIFRFESSDKKSPGTIIKLELLDNNPWKNLDGESVFQTISKQFKSTKAKIKLNWYEKQYTLCGDILDHSQLSSIILREWYGDSFSSKIKLSFNNEEIGIKGNAIIGLIKNQGNFVYSIKKENILFTENKRQNFNIHTSIELSTNRISRIIGTIQLTSKGNFRYYMSKISPNISISDVYIHGVKLGYEIFDNRISKINREDNSSKLHWPFPIVISFNVLDSRRINLNAARNQIINDKFWVEFKKDLSYLVCLELLKSLNTTEQKITIYQIFSAIKKECFVDSTFFQGLEKAYSQIHNIDTNSINTKILNVNHFAEGQVIRVKHRVTYNYGLFLTYANEISEIDGLLHKSKIPIDLWSYMKKDENLMNIDVKIIEVSKKSSERGGLVFGLPPSTISMLRQRYLLDLNVQ